MIFLGSGNNLFKQEKVFQISGAILATKQSLKSFSFIFLGFFLYFKSTFTIKKLMTFGMTLAEHLTMAASANMFYFAIDYENEPNMKVAASNVNIKIHQLFLNSGFLVST